jgi:hypothetical protein
MPDAIRTARRITCTAMRARSFDVKMTHRGMGRASKIGARPDVALAPDELPE